MSERKFYITTPIYYVNARPHIGHLYSTTLADVIARYHRLRGEDVFFLTGTDEHGKKIADAARAEKITPQQFTDRIADEFRRTFAGLEISNDDFIRTTEPRHEAQVQRFIKQLLEQGDVYLGQYEGWYDEGQEEYVTETNAKANDYRSAVSGRPLVRVSEKNYFFRLSKYRQALLDLIEGDPYFVQPEARRNEVLARVREGLNDIAVSRSTEPWGVPMPGAETHSIYVWIDALFNYITAIDTPQRRHFWPADVHLIGKEILWFHAVIWPAMLMALNWPLPRRIYAHSHWIAEGQKMSKSLGNFIDLEKIDEYVSQFSLDALRWFLVTQGPLGSTDSDFAHGRFVDVYNSHLANTLGNCASRVTNMIGRYFDGAAPAPAAGREDADARRLRAAAVESCATVADLYDRLAVGAANEAALELVRQIDGYIELTQPFKLAKDPAQRERLAMVLYYCAESLRIASLHLYPAMPQKIAQLWSMLGVHYDPAHGRLDEWCQWGGLKPGTRITKGESLFPRK
jgi:methionyl-tRNA synthetase